MRHTTSVRGLRAPMRAAVAALALALVGRGVASAEPMGASAEVQVPIFLKALAYDRNLTEKARGDILIGLLYEPGDVESEATARSVAKLMAAYPTEKVIDLPIFYRMIPFRDSTDLSQVIRDEWVDVLYLAPGVSQHLDSVLQVVSGHQVLSMTGVTSYVDHGVSLGVDEREGRPQIVVNLESAENAGSKFAGQFLSLCRVIRKPDKDSTRANPEDPPLR